MTHNRNVNNFRGSNFTFRFVPDFPPPPLPPPLLAPLRPPPFARQPFYPQNPVRSQEDADHEFIRNIESRIQEIPKRNKLNTTTIIQVREEMQSLVTSLKNIETQVKDLRENMKQYSEEDWKVRMDEIEVNKKIMADKLKKLSGSYLDMSRRLLAKRTAKRLRLKRLNEERKLAKKERMKQMEERSRKIDENLQKIKDDILRAKQEEEAKLEADEILREVRRKKQNAKKCMVKLEALMKLRKARENTAKGRGEYVSEKEAASFAKNIEKVISFWKLKLLVYEKEEAELQAKLSVHGEDTSKSFNDTEKEVVVNLAKWREFLFGSTANPQVDFQGDLHRFVVVRSQWDQYLNDDGSPIPVGWVVPPMDYGP
ncbi:uncharacterized protein [Epargyreus clarus]|uniref:uncharacterized protein n=1 Tax=Epargyreus clarus TaxID=520877 RepID=UPI003C2C7565